jgi:endonuclease/exonuclease/phosphatase family metal-dependent hydrolase
VPLADLPAPPERVPPPGASRPARDPALVAAAHAVREGIAAHRTLDSLHASAAWPELRATLASALEPVRRYAPLRPPAPARDAGAVRVVQWNVEHGNWYERVERALLEHPALAGADLLMLNEIDLGMARAANRDVTGDLADALGLHGVWAAQFMETTVGRDDDATTAAGRSNEESLFGLAVLSRWPLGVVRVVPLPGPERLQFELERMLGRFVALLVEVRHPVRPFVAASAHLEVHRTRGHRRAQVERMLDALARDPRPVIAAGDWNTHTFDRGLWHSSFTGALPLLTWTTAALRARLLRPDRGRHREPLFDALDAAGFAWEPWVDYAPTLRLRFDRLDEVNALPGPLRALASGALAWAERRGELRLDWIAARGFARDGAGGETVAGLDGRGAASDHAPIVATLRVPA